MTDKSFDRLIFTEKSEERSANLRGLAAEHPHRKIDVFTEDANAKLPEFCRSMGRFDRAIVFLDPFATEVSWATVEAIADTQKIDCWVLFPLSAIARMMRRADKPPPTLASQLDRTFGGREHWQSVYQESPQLSLFGDAPRHERLPGSDQIADCYRRRLESVFTRVVPTRRTFENSENSPMFELFFGAGDPKGVKPAVCIADHILKYL